MELPTQEQLELQYGQEIKGFLASPAWKDYAWPQLMSYINREFPKPNAPGWEDAYRHAYTLVESANSLNTLLMNLSSRADNLAKKQAGEESDIDLA